MNKEKLQEILNSHIQWLQTAGKVGSHAKLSRANLCRADLSGADLCRTDLSRANLFGADLSRADLFWACLSEADLSGANLPAFQLPHGELVVWKKVQGKLVRLRIPERARRTASLVGRKCRAEYAIVEWVEGGGSVTSDGYGHGQITYEVGKTVYPDSYDDDIRVECSHGVHFFLARDEAKGF